MHCIVLSRHDFREFDQIISLYTKEKGKIKALARGVKKITSKNSAHLEPFSLVEAEIVPGKELNHLTKAVAENVFTNIRHDLQKSLSAGYVVALLDKILHEGEKDERLFNYFLSWLEFLNLQSAICNLQLVDGFIVKLLNCLGYDITQAENLSAEMKKDLEILNTGDWRQVIGYKLPAYRQGRQVISYKQLHDFIYQFFIFQTEIKAKDWLNLARF